MQLDLLMSEDRCIVLRLIKWPESVNMEDIKDEF